MTSTTGTVSRRSATSVGSVADSFPCRKMCRRNDAASECGLNTRPLEGDRASAKSSDDLDVEAYVWLLRAPPEAMEGPEALIGEGGSWREKWRL